MEGVLDGRCGQDAVGRALRMWSPGGGPRGPCASLGHSPSPGPHRARREGPARPAAQRRRSRVHAHRLLRASPLSTGRLNAHGLVLSWEGPGRLLRSRAPRRQRLCPFGTNGRGVAVRPNRHPRTPSATRPRDGGSPAGGTAGRWPNATVQPRALAAAGLHSPPRLRGPTARAALVNPQRPGSPPAAQRPLLAQRPRVCGGQGHPHGHPKTYASWGWPGQGLQRRAWLATPPSVGHQRGCRGGLPAGTTVRPEGPQRIRVHGQDSSSVALHQAMGD